MICNSKTHHLPGSPCVHLLWLRHRRMVPWEKSKQFSCCSSIFFRLVQHLIQNIRSVNARPERLDVPGTRSCELKNSRFTSISNFENSWKQFLFLFGYFIRYDVVIISVVTIPSSCNYTIFLAVELIRVDWPTYPLCLAHLPIVSTC